jgi:hypothetical protein
MEIKPRRGGGSRAAAGFGAGQMPRQSSRRAAAAGVAAAVRAYGGGMDPNSGPAHSPSPSHQQQPGTAAPSAGGTSGKGGGSRRAGSSGRNSRAAESEDDEFWDDVSDEESDEGLTAWGDWNEEDDGACFGGTVLGGDYAQNDYSSLALKPDHYNRPLWVCSDGRIFLETYSPIYKQVGSALAHELDPLVADTVVLCLTLAHGCGAGQSAFPCMTGRCCIGLTFPVACMCACCVRCRPMTSSLPLLSPSVGLSPSTSMC